MNTNSSPETVPHTRLRPASAAEAELEAFGIYVTDCSTDYANPHEHDFLELAYVLQGTAAHTFDRDTCVIRAGDYFIVDYGEVHSYRRISEEPLLLVNVLFRPRLIDETLTMCRSFQELLQNYLIRFSYASLCQPPTRHIFSDTTGEIGAVIEQMRAEFTARAAGFTEMLRSLMIRILILTMRKIRRADASSSDGTIVALTDYVRRNYASDICLSTLCRDLHYSTAYISKKFHEETGTPFSVYLQKYRIEQSCRLLANSTMRIGKVAESVGYSDTKYFTELFRRHVGITPREFRRLHNAQM